MKYPKYLYHGIRLKNPKESLLRGLKIWTPNEVKKILLDAFEYFGISDPTVKEHAFLEIDRRFSNERIGIWVTAVENIACGFARRNPEIISWWLEMTGKVSQSDITNYLEKTFGDAYVLVIDASKVILEIGEKEFKMSMFSTGLSNMFIPIKKVGFNIVDRVYRCVQ